MSIQSEASMRATGNPPHSPARVSRRALLGTGGGLGVLSALACFGAPSASALSAAPLQLGGGTQAFSLAAHAPTGGARVLRAGGGLTTVAVEVSGGHMLGVTFPAGASTDTISVRTRVGGTWSAWADLPLNDSEPDPDSLDARTAVAGSDPLWVGALGSSATVEVRLPAADVATAELHVVDAGSSRTLLSADATDTDVETDTDTEIAAGDTDLPPVSTLSVARPTINSRAAWGADESLRKGVASYSDTIKACVVHHTADGGSYGRADVAAVMRGMYRYHTVSLGWSDLGYNFVVDRFGGIWEGRAGGTNLPVVGAHAGGFNTDTFGVSMMGDFTSVAPSAETLESVARVIAWKLSMYDLSAKGSAVLTSAGGGTARYKAGTTVTLRTINGHRDVGFTACPGNVGYTKMDSIRTRVAALLSSAPASLSAIATKYAALGGAGGFLGRPATAEGKVPSGKGSFQYFSGGAIYATPALGAHVVRGAILAEFARLGWENALGFPTSDDGPAAAGGAYTHFQNGSIYWSPKTGAHDVRGAIRSKWAASGWERGSLGFPVTGDSPARGGFYTHFQGGSIYWSAKTGAHLTRGAIRDRWAALGWEGGLGFPLTDDTATPNGKGWFTHFQGGSIYWSPASGAHAVRGGIRDKWASLGWENGWLGFPTRDEYAVAEGLRTDFQGGTITWNARTGELTAKRS
ncbi:N-acetylmuramoyl-L-alanine amidase [Kineococcus rubinsiae]|uniref:N-acetylmuramoyl-L-alanine amidase n=1 Tax=Kineococcus rubinsiae TaxID=2609562 RepID=UPI001430B12C|nr:N-acetylmuramoyl-L-alanine amidase [Kineococcus rubinsiae]NIZ91501.1 hypothetical protein [Kineococcus rubinsiae]